MAFWGVEIKPGKPFTHRCDASRGRLHISMATLGLGTAITKSTLQCNVGNRSPVFLCVLYPGKTESLQLNLEFEEDGNVVLSVIGPRSIHLCGYYLARRHYTNTMDESESYGEDIADTETERSDHSDEEDYDDSFIDDGGDTAFPQSPISNEEEASSDSGRKSTKGGRRRLRKKYQLVESDDDDLREEKKIVNDNMHVESREIDDEDSLPISSICKNKASGRVLDQEMDDNVDKETVDAGNKDGKDCEDGIIETKLKTDNVVADSQTHREAGLSDQLVDPCSVLNVGDIKKSKKKKKEKEKETKSSCNYHSTEPDNAVQDEPKMNTTQDLLAGNEQNQQQADDKKAEPSDQLVDPCTVLDVGDIKKSKKKKKEKEKETKSSCYGHSTELGSAVQDEPKMNMTQDLLAGNEQNQQQADDKKVETTDKILPSSQVGQGQDEKPKRKRKERSKDETLLTAGGVSISNVINPPQGNEHNSQDTVNGDVKISDTVALPSTETDSQKKTKKRKKEHLNKASQPEGDNRNGEANKETVKSDSLIDKFSERKEQQPKLTIENNVDNDGNQSEDKKVKKKKKKSKSQGIEVVNSDVPVSVEPSTEMMKDDGNHMEDAKPSQVRTLSDGLVIQELETGKANGKIAALGKKISINYTGKLKENGVVVESNAGEAPFKFRLGKGEVIKGWDIGLEGMQVGEKRRLVIPPSLSSKKDGDSGSIPPNSWLVYDFELVKVH